MDLNELLAVRLVSFLMDHYQEIFSVPHALKVAIEGHVAQLRRVQVGLLDESFFFSFISHFN